MTERMTSLNRRTLLGGAAAIGLTGVARAQAPANVKVGLIVPLTGPFRTSSAASSTTSMAPPAAPRVIERFVAPALAPVTINRP